MLPQQRVDVLPHWHRPSLGWDGRSIIRWQHRLKREHPTGTERTKSLMKSADGRVATVANWAEKKTLSNENQKEPT